jgi:AAHS family 4-hydroxybenzoate transporter-like MFS transporter
MDPAHAARVAAMLPIGGTLGSLVTARLMDRMNPFGVLAGAYVLAALAIAATGHALDGTNGLLLTVFMSGFGLSGAQTGANVLAAGYYAPGARATGVAWALGVGRIGSIIGSMTGGLLIARLHTPDRAFLAFALPTLIAASAMLVGAYVYGRRTPSH